jgi:fucose permease
MDGFFTNLIGAGGLLWVAAQIVEFFAVISETGAVSPDADGKKLKHKTLPALLISISALLTPGLLYAHAYVAWASSAESQDPILTFVTTIGSLSVVFVVFGGALIGALIGALAKQTKPLLYNAALPLNLLALVLAFIAALPSLPLLIETVVQRFG